MSKPTVDIAISTCPNDTFAFHGLLTGAVEAEGFDANFHLLDIQQLNDGLMAGKFDVAKASFHAAIVLADETVVLPSGSALGFGVGPLLLASEGETKPNEPTQLTLCPGELTTAHLLFKLFYLQTTRVEQTVFSDIMPRLVNGTADFGVCIHEGRFTWEQQNLHLVEDLGTKWETETGSPLPLGGILARRSLGDLTINKVQSAIRRSIEYGLENRSKTLSTMKKYAVELDDDVIYSHVDLYVNEWTVDLGQTGKDALKTLSTKAEKANIVKGDLTIEVFDTSR